jgi:hypothetical protein
MKNIFAIAFLFPACLFSCTGLDAPDIPGAPQPEVGTFYKGTTLCYAEYLERIGGVVCTENGVPKDPYQSVKDHGGNMVRLMLNVEAHPVVLEQVDYEIDYATWPIVLGYITKAKQVGLDVLLSILEDKLAPPRWRHLSRQEMADSVYRFVYEKLDYLAAHGMMPVWISIGNETNVDFCYYYRYDDPRYASSGGEQAGHNIYVYPEMKYSGWDQHTLWDSRYGSNAHNVHEGMDWMKKNYKPSNKNKPL